ncbi:MAG: sel1 repeat family protein, partial [Sulfuricurvum sp.]|uniref:tetratricopeptide repeat protein n=1 Tax=Sulfuricurvum sp. TaxID=2025608 RepID=UPI0025D50CA1
MKKILSIALINTLLLGSMAMAAESGDMKDRAIKSAQLKAEAGDADGQFALGGLYYQGIVTKQDYPHAIHWFEKAAKQGHDKAQFNLGYMYYDGRGVAKDPAKAFHWFKESAEQGDMKAQLYLAEMFYSGNGTKQDYQE